MDVPANRETEIRPGTADRAPAPPLGARAWLALALIPAIPLAPAGCHHEPRQITPTTTGTDLRNMPRGRMIPLPFPGSSLASSRPAGPTSDPAAATASAESDPR